MTEPGWVRLGRTGDFEEGRPRALEIEGGALFVCRLGERFFCGDDACTHAEFPLSDGDVDGGAIICPLHGARFDLETGRALTPPADDPIRVYETRVEDGALFARIADSSG